MLDVEEGTLSEDTELLNLDNWDSMAAISLIALVDEKFGKQLTGAEIRNFKKVRDILDFMG
jgi:acyl carrier protein